MTQQQLSVGRKFKPNADSVLVYTIVHIDEQGLIQWQDEFGNKGWRIPPFVTPFLLPDQECK